MDQTTAEIGPKELGLKPEAHKFLQELIEETQGIIVQSHGLEKTPVSQATGAIWLGTDSELARALGEDRVSNAAVYTFPQGGKYHDIIYFPSPVVKKLADSTPESRLRGNCVHEMLTVIEETSHYVYLEFYRNKFQGQNPHPANTELIAVIDQYNVLQNLFKKNFGRTMNPSELKRAADMILLGKRKKCFPNGREAIYLISAELGRQYIDLLNGLYGQGKDADSELQNFYQMSNKEQIEHLLYDREFKFFTQAGTPEVDGVQKVFDDLGVQIKHT